MSSATPSSSQAKGRMRTLLNDAAAEAGQDDYSQLPEPIRDVYSRREYLWLTDDQKKRLIQTETEPEVWNEHD